MPPNQSKKGSNSPYFRREKDAIIMTTVDDIITLFPTINLLNVAVFPGDIYLS